MVVETRQTKRARCPTVGLNSGSTASSVVASDRKTMERSSKSLKLDVTGVKSTIPKGFICPLTMDVMYDPVLDNEGNSFERDALLEWLNEKLSSPVSRQPLSMKLLVPNIFLRDAIHEFMGNEWVKRQQLQRQKRQNVSQDDNLKTNSLNLRSAKSLSTPVNLEERTVDADALTDSKNEHKTCAKPTLSPESVRLRTRVDCYLQQASIQILKGTGTILKLNPLGYCAFQYDNITIVLDVPDQVGVFCLYTKNLIPNMMTEKDSMDKEKSPYSNAQRHAMIQHAMKLNFLQGGTRGGCLSLTSPTNKQGAVNSIDDSEIIFSYTDRIMEVTARDFTNILFNYIETCINLRNELLIVSASAAVTDTVKLYMSTSGSASSISSNQMNRPFSTIDLVSASLNEVNNNYHDIEAIFSGLNNNA